MGGPDAPKEGLETGAACFPFGRRATLAVWGTARRRTSDERINFRSKVTRFRPATIHSTALPREGREGYPHGPANVGWTWKLSHTFQFFGLDLLVDTAISHLLFACGTTESLAILLGRHVEPPGESRSHMRGAVEAALERNRLERSVCLLEQPPRGVDANLLDKRGRCHLCILREEPREPAPTSAPGLAGAPQTQILDLVRNEER